MPIYEYMCPKCGAIKEVIEKFEPPSVHKCEEDGRKMSRVISICGWALKGGGWYDNNRQTHVEQE